MNQHITFATQDHSDWQPVEYEILRRMAAAGKTDQEMAEMIGRSRWSVQQARDRLRLPSSVPATRWTAAEMQKLEELFMQGFSDAQIAAALGRNFDSVKSKRQLMGLDGDLVDRRKVDNPVRRRFTSASELFGARPCPINAEYEERVRANAAYLLAAMRAGHPVFSTARGPA